MKKIVSVLFAVLFALSVFAIPASADAVVEEENYASTAAVFHSNIAGLTEADHEKLADLSAGNLEFRVLNGDVRVSVYDCVGTPYHGEIKPGRKYEIDYEFIAAHGYVLRKEFTKDDLDFTFDKGYETFTCQYIDNIPANAPQNPLLYVRTYLVTDSSIFQRIVGWIADAILTIRAWSLY